MWDIVLDHDNLGREIDRAIERIEKSHLRGQGCVLYSELQDFDGRAEAGSSMSGQQVPRVFALREELVSNQSALVVEKKSCRHYPPASDDPRQFTLLKFYELDAAAIDCLLQSENQDTDLPFVPGPTEYQIINQPPGRSILLMGRRYASRACYVSPKIYILCGTDLYPPTLPLTLTHAYLSS